MPGPREAAEMEQAAWRQWSDTRLSYLRLQLQYIEALEEAEALAEAEARAEERRRSSRG